MADTSNQESRLESDKERKMDLDPPAASVHRIIKASLPENCQVTKESKAAFSKAAGIFILYLTSCANDFCVEQKKTTVAPSDVISALKELDMSEFVAPLEEFLIQWRKEETSKKSGKTDGAAAH